MIAIYIFSVVLLITPGVAKEGSDLDKDSNSFVDVTHRYISDKWRGLNYNVDSFFANRRYKKSENRSQILAYYGIYKKESAEEVQSYDLRLKIHLPKTTKKMKLVVERERDEIAESMNSEAENMRKDHARKANPEYLAGITYETFKTKMFDSNLDIGTKLMLPLNPYMKLNVQKNIQLKVINISMAQRFILYRQNGFKEVTHLSFGRSLGRNVSIGQANSLGWADENDDFELRNTLSLGHQISKRRSLSYSAGASAHLSPTLYYYTYDVSMSYRQLIHKDWLLGNIVFGADFPKTDNFKPSGFVGGKLEVFFR